MIIIAQRKIQKQQTTTTTTTTKQESKFVYCGNWKCTIYGCERHHLKQPWNTPIFTHNWEPKDMKRGKCDGLL